LIVLIAHDHQLFVCSRRMAVAIQLRRARANVPDGRSALRTQGFEDVPPNKREMITRASFSRAMQIQAARATPSQILQHGSSQHTVPWQNGGRQKDQLPETNPKGGGQAHPSMQGRRSIQSGDEPSWRRPSDRTTLRLSASHDPSGSVFSSLVQEQADIRSDDQSCNLMLPS